MYYVYIYIYIEPFKHIYEYTKYKCITIYIHICTSATTGPTQSGTRDTLIFNNSDSLGAIGARENFSSKPPKFMCIYKLNIDT
jgi:hypothetical protein